jgi:hypothetical protein
MGVRHSTSAAPYPHDKTGGRHHHPANDKRESHDCSHAGQLRCELARIWRKSCRS